MKTAVCLPDELFAEAERFARRAGRSRSELYAAVLGEYLARHSADEVTAAFGRLMQDLEEDEGAQRFAERAAEQLLRATEW